MTPRGHGLCELLPDSTSGRSTSFLVDMNKVFERFVHLALEEHLERPLAYQRHGDLAAFTTGDGIDRAASLARNYDTTLVGPEGTSKSSSTRSTNDTTEQAAQAQAARTDAPDATGRAALSRQL